VTSVDKEMINSDKAQPTEIMNRGNLLCHVPLFTCSSDAHLPDRTWRWSDWHPSFVFEGPRFEFGLEYCSPRWMVLWPFLTYPLVQYVMYPHIHNHAISRCYITYALDFFLKPVY